MDPFFAALGLSPALVPGLWLWFRRRSLSLEDPLFAERNGRAFVGAGVAIIAAGVAAGFTETPWYAVLPTVVFSMLVGLWAVDRSLWGYEWSLPESMSYRLRSVTASFGFWIALGFAPLIITSLPAAELVAVGACVGFFLWSHFYNGFRVWISRAEPIDVSGSPLMQVVLERTSVKRVHVYRIPSGRGACPQAFANPQKTGMSVHIGDTLFDVLTPEELAGVFGHEVAHLEQAESGDLPDLGWWEQGITLFSVVILPGLVIWGSELWYWLAVVWPPLVIFGLLRFMARRRANESHADERGAELSGQPEAMITALEKIHALNGASKRMAAEHQDHATHPDFIHRKEALETDEQPADVGSLAVEDVRKPGKIAALDGEAITVTHNGAVTRLSYEGLSVLTVIPSWRGPLLVGQTPGQQETSVYVEPAKVAEIQAFLDKIHARVGTDRAPAMGWAQWVMVGAAFFFVFGWVSMAMVFWGAWGVFKGDRVAWGGVRAMLVGSAILTLLGWTSALPVVEYGWPVALIAGGAGLYPWQMSARPNWIRRHVVVMGVLALCTLAWMAVAWGHHLGDATRLHFQLRENPALVLMPLAFAGALFEMKPLWSRGLGFLPLAVGLALMAVGSDAFRSGFVGDPMAVGAPPATVEKPELSLVHQVVLPDGDGQFRMSSDGTRWGRQTDDEWWIGTIGSEPQVIPADDIQFTGEHDLVILLGGELGGEDWSLDVDLVDPHLRVSGEQWILTGTASAEGPFVHMRGETDVPAVTVATVKRPLDEAVVASRGTWTRHLRDSERNFNSMSMTGHTLMSDGEVTWSLGRPQTMVQEAFKTGLWSSCMVIQDRIVCGVAATGSLVHLPVDGGDPRGLIALGGMGAWLSSGYGSRVAVWTESRLLVVDLTDGTTLEIPADPYDCVDTVLGDGVIGMLTGCEARTLSVYTLPEIHYSGR